MANVTIKLVSEDFLGEFYFQKDPKALAQQLLKEGRYRKAIDFFFDQEGTDAAEEAFDLTNNPSREYERAKYYGQKRSVSVGDIVEVDGVDYLCASMGWQKVA